jgi:hypothetical protein
MMTHSRANSDHCHPEGEARGTFKATGKVPRYARDDSFLAAGT